METTTLRLPFLIVLLFSCLAHNHRTLSAARHHPNETDSTTTTIPLDFIITSCNNTTYPDLCKESLSFYARYIGKDQARLAIQAIVLSQVEAKSMVSHLYKVSHKAEPKAAAAISDCKEIFNDAVGSMTDSVKQMKQLRGSTESMRFQMSNVQTWMSAALSDESSCTDGVAEGLPDGPLKTGVINRVSKAERLTSIALALIANYAHNISIP